MSTTNAVSVPTFADKMNAAGSKPSVRIMTDQMRALFDMNAELATEITDGLAQTTADRFDSQSELATITLCMPNDTRRKVIGRLSRDEYLANYDNRLATAKTVHDHLIAAHLTYREGSAGSYKMNFSAAKVEAGKKAGIHGKTAAAIGQSAVRLAQYAVLCDQFGARDFPAVAYLIRNRLTGWARFDKTAARWNVESPIIGAPNGSPKFRTLIDLDVGAVRKALAEADAVRRSESDQTPDAAFCAVLVSAGLMDAKAVKELAEDIEGSDAAVDAAVASKDTLPIVDAFAALNVDNAATCLRAWIAAHNLDNAATLAEALQVAIASAFPADAATAKAGDVQTDSEVYADDESAVLNNG